METEGSDGANNVLSKRSRREVSRETKSYPRKRALKACTTCRMRKTKCNNEKPICGFCQSLGARCVYDDTAHDISTLDAASQLIIERLDQLLQKVDQSDTQSSVQFNEVLHKLRQIPFSGDLSLGQSDHVASSRKPVSSTPALLQERAIDLIEDENMMTPTCQTSPDAVLDWPVFAGKYPWGYITDSLFAEEFVIARFDTNLGSNRFSTSGRLASINEEAIPRLVEIFLSRVHTKCPVLDVETARNYASDMAREGLRWNGPSCLTLIMAALGCMARPFSDLYNQNTIQGGDMSSQKLHSTSLSLAKVHYDAACKRIGLLDASILSAQCIFLCGVYEMYNLNPLKAWRSFSNASSTLYTHLRCQDIYARDNPSVRDSTVAQRLEASIYWSAYKSMCELRTEIPLPASLLAEVKYSHLLPTPPSNLASDMGTNDSTSPIFAETPESFSQLQSAEISSLKMQEQAWFFYLTDIMLSRLGTRVLLNIYDHGHHYWNEENLHIMLRAADEFERQLNECLATLPESIQFDDFDIRPSHELRFIVQFRALEIRSWLYRPFLYYTIHHKTFETLTPRLQSLVLKAIDTSIHWILLRPVRHRHHGSWYAGRLVLSSALVIVAAVKAQIRIDKLSDWKDIIKEAISAMEFWQDESPDFKRGREALEALFENVNGEENG